MTFQGNDKVRRRLPRQERERLIVDEAIRFFAEVGFEGQTRALAQRLGVTQPLLYRYFPDKDALIERVYQEVFLAGGDPGWEPLLNDRSRPLADRLTELYTAYANAHFNYERVRLFMYASLKDDVIATRYIGFIHDQLFVPMAREMRHAAGLGDSRPPSPTEIELAAALHGAIAYFGFRRWIFNAPVPVDTTALIRSVIDSFLGGVTKTLKGLS